MFIIGAFGKQRMGKNLGNKIVFMGYGGIAQIFCIYKLKNFI